MRRALEKKGAAVVAQAAFGSEELDAKAGIFGPRAFGEGLARLATIKEAIEVPV
jgi:hypothetical protein